MRVVRFNLVVLFYFLISPAIVLAYLSYQYLTLYLSHPFFRYAIAIIGACVCFYSVLLLIYRCFLNYFPFPPGNLEMNSCCENRWMIYVLFWLLFFYPLVLPKWIPVPLTGILYRLFGARIGSMSYFSSMIYDPHLVEVGHHVIGGAQSMIIPHAIEGVKLAHYPIRIGNHVTIGAGAIILPGVKIEDHVLIGAGAVVIKDSHLKFGEIWVGNPAKCISQRKNLLP
jgi:hypothetical protein